MWAHPPRGGPLAQARARQSSDCTLWGAKERWKDLQENQKD